MKVTDDTTDAAPMLRAMFVARKEVFIDLLKWDLPALDGRFEVDQFDTAAARYLIVGDQSTGHRASARLLPTTQPHILQSLFPELCHRDVPASSDCLEITRFCLDRHQLAGDRREARDHLIAGLVRFALAEGITSYTGVAEIGWFQQVLSFGWHCRALGLPRAYGRSVLTALQIDIDVETPRRLREAGITGTASSDEVLDYALKVAA